MDDPVGDLLRLEVVAPVHHVALDAHERVCALLVQQIDELQAALAADRFPPVERDGHARAQVPHLLDVEALEARRRRAAAR